MDYKEEKKIFLSYLKRKGLKHTAQRDEILKTFLSEEKHLTADDLYLLVMKKNPAIGHATVYRTLKLLCGAGLASEIYLKDNRVRYEHKYGHRAHEHMVCVHCGKTIELRIPEIESLVKKVEKEHGFKLNDYALKLSGICAKCGKEGK